MGGISKLRGTKDGERKMTVQSYNYSGKVPGACSPEGFDLLNWMLLKIEGGKVVELRAGQVTSC